MRQSTKVTNCVKTENMNLISSFKGSPMSQGTFQFDMWNVDESNLSGMWGLESKLKKSVMEYGVCNSLFTAQMPVASSAKNYRFL